MKFKTPNCPECGGFLRGTLETVQGVAEIQKGEGNNLEYGGYTDIWWDEQRTVQVGNQVTLVCEEGYQWLSEVEDAEGLAFDPESPSRPAPETVDPFEFIRFIARMKTEGEWGEDMPPSEDWIASLNELIAAARKFEKSQRIVQC